MTSSIEAPISKEGEIARLEAELLEIRDKKNGGPDDAKLALEEKRIVDKLSALRDEIEHEDIT